VPECTSKTLYDHLTHLVDHKDAWLDLIDPEPEDGEDIAMGNVGDGNDGDGDCDGGVGTGANDGVGGRGGLTAAAQPSYTIRQPPSYQASKRRRVDRRHERLPLLQQAEVGDYPSVPRLLCFVC
jgi:hypothetical protein